MKKLLGIVVLGLLWCNTMLAKEIVLSCKKLKLEDMGYSCEELESKQISKIEKGETSNNKYRAVIKSKKGAMEKAMAIQAMVRAMVISL